MTASFLGIDMAWRSDRNPSGAVALAESVEGLEIADVSKPLRGLEDIETFVARYLGPETVIAIDAPLIITNRTGQRRCELSVSRQFGARHASCHSSNLTLYPDPASVRLAAWLDSLGFSHATRDDARTMIEVYPHAAFITLFELPSIIRYKKGSVAGKCAGLRIVQQTLARLPVARNARLEALLQQDPSMLSGQNRKSFEDSLDALFCAYLAYHFSRWREPHWDVFGDRRDGYIANPSTPLAQLAAQQP